MKSRLRALLVILMTALAATSVAAGTPAKVALVSLIGDVMTIDTYRSRVGTSINRNHQDLMEVPKPVFDQAALAVAAEAVYKRLPEDAVVATLAVPKPGSGFDPAALVVDGALDTAHPLVAALRREGFTQLLAITKHRAAARFGLADGAIGSGEVQGLGFYVDPSFKTRNPETGATATGFIAPYVYIRLVLIDLAGPKVQGQQAITASVLHTDPGQAGNANPWATLSDQQKATLLMDLLTDHVAQAVPQLFVAR